MGKIEDDLSDEIEERIDKRLALLRDSMELKLTKEFDSLLKTRAESIGKILSIAFGLVAIVFAGFGIKTFLDIREIARDTAIEEVKKKLLIDDPNSEFRRDVDTILARGVLNSYLLQSARDKGKRFSSPKDISSADFARIRNLIEDPDSTLKDFTDAVEVLSSVVKDDPRDKSFKWYLHKIGSGSDEKFRWIETRPDKRAAIFSTFTEDSLVDAATKILNQKDVDKNLQISMIKYLGNRGTQSIEVLERCAANTDEDIVFAAQLVLARIAPQSDALKAAFNKPEKTKETSDWVNSVRIATELAKPRRKPFSFTDDPNAKQRREMAAIALQKAIDSGLFFRASRDFRTNVIAVYVSSTSELGTLYSVSADLISGNAAGAVNELLRRSASQSDVLARNIRALCLIEEEQYLGFIRANLEQGGRIILQSGIELSKSDAPAGFTLRPSSTRADSSINISWTDRDAVRQVGILKDIADPEKAFFSIVSSEEFESSDEL